MSERRFPESHRSVLAKGAAVNALLCVVECIVGLWSESAVLIADAMNFFEVAGICGVAALGWAARQRGIAGIVIGAAMCGIGFVAAVQAASHSYFDTIPDHEPMIVMAIVALAAHVFSAARLSRFAQNGSSSWLAARVSALHAVPLLVAITVMLTGLPWADIVGGGTLVAVNMWSALTIIVPADKKVRGFSKRTDK